MNHGFDSSIPEETRNRAMMRQGSLLLRNAIYEHFGLVPPAPLQPVQLAAVRVEPHVPLFGQLLLSVAAGHYGMTADEAKAKGRLPEQIEVRALVIDVLRARRWSYTRIAELIGRDHSSVDHALTQLPNYLKRSAKCREVYAALAKYRTPDCEDAA